jgi:hypothetical protein
MAEPLLALTLQIPWPWAIAHAEKRIENRTWAPPARLIGRVFAIHAGKAADVDGMKWLWKRGILSMPMPREAHVRGAIVALATLDSVVRESDDPWFCGPVGWVLRDVFTLPVPIDCRGYQGLWPVPPELADLCWDQRTPRPVSNLKRDDHEAR